MQRAGLASLAIFLIATSAAATDKLNPVEGSRRLRQLGGRVAALSDSGSGITRDVGSIAIIEHDGSNYDAREDDGVTPNYAARAAVARRFYESHGDFYDFLVVFTNFDFKTAEALAFHSLIRNDVRGIGIPVVDNGSAFGSPGRLKGYVDMAAVARYSQPPLGLDPAGPGFTRTLNVLAHEVAHQWLAEARFRDASGHDSADLLKGDGHWSYLLDSDASVMYGADWVPRDDGRHAAARVQDGYFNLDLYLMGLLEPAKVTPFSLLRNPAVSANAIPAEDDVVEATPETVTIDQVIAAEGTRSPDFQVSPKAFRLGFIFLTRPGTDPSAEDLEAVERVRRFFAGRFFALTRGVAVADTTLAEAPPLSPAGAPDLDRALAWLVAQQMVDGRWEDSASTAIRDTSAALDALLRTGHAGEAVYQHGRSWAAAASAPNLDFASRRATAIAPGLDGPSRAAVAGAILAQQNADGGFGAAAGYESDALDTALTLRALGSLQAPLDARIRRALLALGAMRTASGGWPIVPGGGVSTLVTAYAVLAAEDWPSAAEGQAVLGPGLGALLARQNPDHGFGESPSTPYATALALQALLRAPSAPADAVDGAIGWLRSAQSADGSWGGSRFQTALVLDALEGSVAANLVVPSDGLALDPAAPREGEHVRVAARIRNSGRTAAGGSRARLFDGDPKTGEAVGVATVPPLEPGDEAAVSFDYPTAEKAGDRTLYVVADADGEVAEAREDDNAASRALHVEGFLPDLVIHPGDADVTPYPPEEGETVRVSVRVTNEGRRAAGSNRLLLADGDPRQGGRVLGEATVPPLAIGEAAVLVLPWNTTGARGDHVLFVAANADFAVREADPANDELAFPVTVTGPPPAGPDLAVTSLTLSPSSLTALPDNIGAEALVRNLGRSPASSTIALYDGDPATRPPVAQWSVALPPRSSIQLSATVTVADPGDRSFVAVADPADTLAEADENNNRASTLLRDPHDALDVAVFGPDLAPSATDLVVGETLTVAALVRNRGTVPVTAIPVILGRVTEGGLDELARSAVSLAAGSAAPVTLAWTTSFTGDPATLAVRVDPFGLLTETSESNNTAPLSVRIRPSSRPNLNVSGAAVSFLPDPPREGEAAMISAVVRNPSPVAAGAFAVRFFRGDPDHGGEAIGESIVPGVGALGEATAAITWSPVDVRGAQGVFVVADARGEVEEYDEADNQAFRPFSVLGLPDLVLTTGDVVVEPRYPRAGEPVTIHATVRNMGGLPTPEAVLRAIEGAAGADPAFAEVTIPPLAAGAAVTLEVGWTPASPPGGRTLTLIADADEAVREQDEGNNLARRAVIVQDADLFLTERYFSPDGDGSRDETTLAYRATSIVSVVVANDRGQLVRTLATGGPSSGQVTWDGRDDHGRLLADGTYTITLAGEGGVVLGRLPAALDTNRSAIHEAAGTGLVATSNLTCALPDSVRGPVFTPAEDATLFIVTLPTPAFPSGLVRVGLDGSYAYVAQDPWYASASFPISSSQTVAAQVVSPDGREVLVERDGDLHSVDLLSGDRRLVRAGMRSATWSPDGRFITGLDLVVSRGGDLVGELPGAGGFLQGNWAWSPDGEFLATGTRIVRRDGTGVRTFAKPPGTGPSTLETTWRGDGKIITIFGSCGDGCSNATAWVLDPETGTITEAPWLASVSTRGWSPDGSRVLYRDPARAVSVAREDGSGALRLVGFDATASPRAATASYSAPRPPALAGTCNPGRSSDILILTSLQNLTADFFPTRLPGNDGILVRGTVTDRNLDHYQLEYARQEDPGTWHPLGPASEVPVIDDVLAAWVPAAPGSYLLRLRAYDRAGNARTRTHVVAWDRFPALANVTQSEFLISPNGDGIKDQATFDYLVMEPTRVEVRVVGPERAGADALPPPLVRAFSREHSATGPSSFTWDGRDGSGVVVTDGRYTVLVNDLPFRVEVDATPPDIAFAESDLRTEPTHAPLRSCGPEPLEVGTLTGERRWHVVDSHLQSWSAPDGSGTQPLYEPERDASGQILYDENGVPRVRRLDGRAVDRRDRLEIVGVSHPGGELVAEDYAGNRSVVPILPVEEALRILDARAECAREAALWPPLETGRVYALTIPTVFRLAETISGDAHEVTVRFQYRPKAGGSWTDAPAFAGKGVLSWKADLLQLGLQVGTEYLGRFLTVSGGRDVTSEEFLFRPCNEYLALRAGNQKPVLGTELVDYSLELVTAVHEPLAQARLTVRTLLPDGRAGAFQMVVPMDRIDGATFRKTVRAPRATCDGLRLSASVEVAGESGRIYQDDRSCARLAIVVPECPCRLAVRQQQGFCQAAPNAISLRYSAESAYPGARVQVESGDEEDPTVVGTLPVGAGVFEQDALLDAAGLGEGMQSLRARIVVPGDPELTCARARLDAVVDRTPPVLSVLQPVEGARICGDLDVTGHEVASITVQPADLGPEVALEAAEFRSGDSAWRGFVPVCPGAPGSACADRLPTGPATVLGWDVTGLPEGDHSVRLRVCDQAGNKTTTERRLVIGREPPSILLRSVTPAVISPNDDGRSDGVTVVVRTVQSLRFTVQVRQGTDVGPIVRTLASAEELLPGDLPFVWDGRDEAGGVASDGLYFIVVAGADPCGRATSVPASAVVDTRAPLAALTHPAAGAAVHASVDVRGTASDAHFLSYELAVGAGPSPTSWSVIGGGTSEAPATASLLGRWDAPAAPGVYTLRLKALDVAGNEAAAFVTVDVTERATLDHLAVDPIVFSPNGDGRRESVTIEYGLLAGARVTLQVRDVQGNVVRTLEGAAVHGPGTQALTWQGQSDDGQPAPEGDLVIWAHAEDPEGAWHQEEAVGLVLDRTPPAVNVERPRPDASVTPSTAVHGSITDPRLATYAVTATPPGGTAIEVTHGAQARADADLAFLTGLPDGPYVLSVTAEDGAENRARVDTGMTIDSAAPRVAIAAPGRGAVLLKGTAPVDVVGSVTDAGLEGWTLKFGAGLDPAGWVEIARATTGGVSFRLAAWAVASLPDGAYVLLLEATDRSGQTSDVRSPVILDSGRPEARITVPIDGASLGHEGPVIGTARDPNLEEWRLESAPGPAASAFQWSPLASGTSEVSNAPLATWSPLPPDGVHSLRLTVRDRAGFTASATATVTVDTGPPAAPTGLTADVTRTGGPTADVRITWNAGPEPDLAGYRVSRDGAELTPDAIHATFHPDPGRAEGVYRYSVVAVDHAGNVSGPAEATVRLDLTPPIADIQQPAPGASVSGSVEIRGTAFSAPDFKEYRLLAGAGDSPTTFALVHRSILPVLGGLLGTWSPASDGPYQVVVEAEDLSGNVSRTTRAFVVDNQPPASPVLTSLTIGPGPTSLTSVWANSPSADTVGYLVYRNGLIANASGIVTGSLRAYLVPGTSFVDPDVPDGHHCMRVLAMDAAGNLSVPSNEICQDLDNRPPQAVILQPAGGTRFQYPIRIVAGSIDRDIASVRFQRQADAAASWDDIGAVDTAEPFETVLDPGGLAFGDYRLRAVATDRGGRSDPEPASITVTYGDATAPARPRDLATRVDGSDVRLSWSAGPEPDLDGYRVSRDHVLLSLVPATEPSVLIDSGVAPGVHEYEVTALDRDGNESAPSDPAEALVYALSLLSPYPVTESSAVALSGGGSHGGTTVQVFREETVVAEAPASAEAFVVPGVPLLPGGNVLHARARDVAGNLSIPSPEVVLILNAPPADVTGLTASVAGHDVGLAWDPVGDDDLFGYEVRRGNETLTRTSLQTQAAVDATSSRSGAGSDRAFDGKPNTVWVPSSSGLPAAWWAAFETPILIDRVTLRFGRLGGAAAPVPAYRIEARWEDRYVPLVHVTSNAAVVVEHAWPAPFATDVLRVVVESGDSVGLAEVTISKLEVVAAGTTSFTDAGVADGSRSYAVVAIDRYGARSAPATVQASVGDVVPPAAPQGLTAVTEGRDVVLAWDASVDADVTLYAVLRDGTRIATTASTGHRDATLPNGTYRYTVLAADAAGNEGPESEPAIAVVDAPATPPGAPAIMVPTDAAHPITLDSTSADVRGQAAAGSIVSLDRNGGLAATAEAQPGSILTARVQAPTPSSAVAVSPDAANLAFAMIDDDDDDEQRASIRLVDAIDGSTEEIDEPTYEVLRSPAFSPDSHTLSFLASRSAGGSVQHLLFYDLADRTRTLVLGGPVWIDAVAWSPAGDRLAVVSRVAGAYRLEIRDLASGATSLVATAPVPFLFVRWSPDASYLAVTVFGGAAFEERVLDIAHGTVAVVPASLWSQSAPSWSADSRRLAFTAAGAAHLQVLAFEVATGAITALTDGTAHAYDPRFNRDGAWLSYTTVVEGAPQTVVRIVARNLGTDEEVVVGSVGVGSPNPSVPRLHEWVSGSRLAILLKDQAEEWIPANGFFEMSGVTLAPGANVLVARATEPSSGATGPDSEPVLVTVAPARFPNPAVSAPDVSTYPTVAAVGQSARLAAVVRNLGGVAAEHLDVRLRVSGADGGTVVETTATLLTIPPGGSATVSGFWTPSATGTYLLRAQVDPDQLIGETSEDDNEASTAVWVVAPGGLAATVASDRSAYSSESPAVVQVQLASGGPEFAGTVRTSVEDTAGQEVAVLDTRDVTLAFGQTMGLAASWNTGTTYAGDYAFRVRAVASGGGDALAEASQAFAILPDVVVSARLVPDRASLGAGQPAGFAVQVRNGGLNAPLESLQARLRVQPDGSTTPAFAADVALPRLLPGAAWETNVTWPSAAPSGRYTAELQVVRDGPPLATASASITVTPAGMALAGTLALDPPSVLAGATFHANVTISNLGGSSLSALPVRVEVTSGPAATVVASAMLSLDLAAGEQRSATVAFDDSGIAPGPHAVFLRAGDPASTLDRATLRVHGPITPPSVDSPSDGTRVGTAHPMLSVNNASSAEGARLTYEFELFADSALTQPLPGVSGVREGVDRTAWPVAVNLVEDRAYYWRARATDGFSLSAWTPAAAFTVDASNLPPSAPVPDTPFDRARVASREPTLTVSNSQDPELDPLTYEFSVASDAGMSTIVASTSGVASGPGLTSWSVPFTLAENATYFWSARAHDARAASAPSVPISFLVDTVNESPSAPTPIAPIGGAGVASLTPELQVANATDPEGDGLTYRFEVDTAPSFDSPAHQVSPAVAESPGRTAWTPAPLADNTLHYWRAAASDGSTFGPSTVSRFFVNLANDPPGVPVLVDPVDGRTVTTLTPALRIQNTTDDDHDPLTYEFEVRDAAGAVVASAIGIVEGVGETSWTVPAPLAEDTVFSWSARANDGITTGTWSAPESFHVSAVASPPTAPSRSSPAEDALVGTARPTLVVSNATSPDGSALTYAFEVYLVGPGDSLTLVAQVVGVPEGSVTTSWVLAVDLADGAYAWRARASDPLQTGPWMNSAHFRVQVDIPPAPPSALQAIPGDRRVTLTWNAAPETDVIGYRVYRGAMPGGPYGFVAATALPSFEDTGLANGVTVRYVVTALDSRFESGQSAEASATPTAPPPGLIPALVHFKPATIAGDCLLVNCDSDRDHRLSEDHGDDDDDDGGDDACPRWIYATIELPAGINPAAIERPTVRVAGAVPPDPFYGALVDEDHDGIRELRLRFAFRDLQGRLTLGSNTLRTSGRVAGNEFRGDATVQVSDLDVDLFVTPRTLLRRSQGDPVQARLTFRPGIAACEVSLSSIRLNGTVPAAKKLSCEGSRVTVKFDRAAVITVMPVGDRVEVRVTGTIRGLAFETRDFIRVTP